MTALDRDSTLLDELARRANRHAVETVVADARAFELGRRFALIIVPMQTIQLLGGAEGRAAFLACARRHLEPGGALAVAITEQLELFDERDGASLPLPDMLERDGLVYCSQATAVRRERGGYVLERRRELVDADGAHTSERDLVRVDPLSAAGLESEARVCGLRPAGRRSVAPTPDHVGSEVVLLDG